MKRTYNFVTAIIFFAFVFPGVGKSQDLQETLTKLTGSAGQSYVAPIISAFGSNLNSGWVHKSPSSKIFGIDIEVGVVAMATMFGDNNKSFNTSGTFRFDSSQARTLIEKSDAKYLLEFQKSDLALKIAEKEFTVGISGPTIVGDKKSEVMVNFSPQTVEGYHFDSSSIHTGAFGFLGDLKALPLFAPQLSIGTVYGTMLTFRFLPSIEIQKLGKFSYFGFGIQHNPAMFIPVPLPIDISATFFTQTLKVGDIFKATATTFGIYASKTFGFVVSVTPYAGISMESSSVDVSYDVNYATPVPGVTVPGKIAFTMKGENKARMTVGASIKLAVLNISADYSFAKYKAASLGVNFIF